MTFAPPGTGSEPPIFWGRTYRFHCPRCQRGLSTSKLLSRPQHRTDGPAVCMTCVKDELRQARTEEARREVREHARKLAEAISAHPSGKGR